MADTSRHNDLQLLHEPFRTRITELLERMKLRGFDPILFETLRTLERQKWLYEIGRTREKDRKPVTWTMKSKHFSGQACDIVSKSRLWDWPEFFSALRQEANRLKLRVLRTEQCHVEWAGQ